MTEVTETQRTLEIRHATVSDGAPIWRLVQDCTVLDTNSCYAYLLLCRDFADTTLVATDGDDVLGFVAAYIPPNQPDTVFVWQIGAAGVARRRGIGKSLLRELLNTNACRNVRYLEATVTPSNSASARLFRSIAEMLGTGFERLPGFQGNAFGLPADDSREHEPEDLVRIGPIK